MPVAGIDMGSLTTKVIVLEDGQVVGRSLVQAAEEGEVQARAAFAEALKETGLSLEDLEYIVATGGGRKQVPFAHKQRTLLSCLAKGVTSVLPQARTVIDVGGETCTIVRINDRGGVEDSVGNDRCASGSGVFLESMAKLMQMPLERMARESLSAKARAPITSMCAIFAEQEVISHVHRNPPTPKNDVIAGIHASMVTRILGFAKRIGVKEQVVLTGGVARNVGFARILEEDLATTVHIPQDPELVAALGAALIAGEEKQRKA